MRISDWSSDVCSSDLEKGKTWAPALSAICVGRCSDRPGAEFRNAYRRQNLCDGSSRSRRRRNFPRPEAVRLYQHRCARSEEHTSELQSLMRISYAVFCLKKKTEIKHLPNQNTPQSNN